MRNVNPHLLGDKMDEAVTHYITHQPSGSVHVDANTLALNIQEDEGSRVVTVMPQNFSQQMCRQVSVGEHVEGWGEEMLDPDGRLAAIVAQLAKSGAPHYHPPHKLTSVRGDVESSVMLDGQLRLFNAQTLEQQGDSIVVQMPPLPPLPPLQEMKRCSDADWFNKSKNNMKTNSVLDSEGQVLELSDASPGQHRQPSKKSLPHKKRISRKLKRNTGNTTPQQTSVLDSEGQVLELSDASPGHNRQPSKKSLPHKKRISRKLKRNTGNTTPQQDIVVISCNDEVQQEEILPDNYVTQVQHQTHLADDAHNITHEVRPVLICCICGEYYGEEQLKFYQHLKQHYEPHATIIIENPVSDLGIDKMTNTCIEDNVANLPDSIVELSLENTVPKTMYQTMDKHILYTSSDKTLQYSSNKLQYSMASMDKEVPSSEVEKADLYDTLDKLEMYNCMKCNKTFRKQKQCEAHIKEVHGKLEDMGEFSEPEDLMEGIHVAVEGVEPGEGEPYEQALLPHLTVENGTVHQEHVRHCEPEHLMEGIHVAVEGVEPGEGEPYEQALLPHLTVENGTVHQEHVRHCEPEHLMEGIHVAVEGVEPGEGEPYEQALLPHLTVENGTVHQEHVRHCEPEHLMEGIHVAVEGVEPGEGEPYEQALLPHLTVENGTVHQEHVRHCEPEHLMEGIHVAVEGVEPGEGEPYEQALLPHLTVENGTVHQEHVRHCEPEHLMEGIHVAVEGVEPGEGEPYEQALLPHLTVENGTVHQEHVRHCEPEHLMEGIHVAVEGVEPGEGEPYEQALLPHLTVENGTFSEPEHLMEGIHVAVEGVEPGEGEPYEQALLPHLTVENGTVHQEHVRHWYMRGNQPTACGPDAYCPVCPARPDQQHDSQLKEEVFQRIFDVEVPAAENSNFADNIIPDTEIPEPEKPDDKPEKGKKGKSFECPQCSRVFQHRNSLLYHVLSHKGKQHVCRECNKGFYTSGALKIHKRVHNGDRPYKCEECDREFRQWSDLKYHKVSLHSNQKHFKCEFCSKEFARKYSLSVHRRIHTGERNYKCEYCNKSFRASSYRLSHMRTHTGDKPFKCPTCGKCFRVAGDLRRHALTHDKLTRDKPPRVKHEPDKSPKKYKKDREHKKKQERATTKLPILKSILDKKSPKSKRKIGAPNVTVDPDKEQFKINTEFTNNVEVFDSRNYKFKEIYVGKDQTDQQLRQYELEDRLPDERNFAVLKPMFRPNESIQPEKVYDRSQNTDGKMAVFTQVERKEYVGSIVSNTQVTLADINRHLEREPREVRSDSLNGEAIENGILERLAALYNIPAV
ncbi:uncharacterized protein LOC134662701 [Cydia amplana]|uniref:uncharacterized protein LOC134662701 n=1 Tax=Cydia amplana TaxID=1869771 RepID=UPI002FE6BB8D